MSFWPAPVPLLGSRKTRFFSVWRAWKTSKGIQKAFWWEAWIRSIGSFWNHSSSFTLGSRCLSSSPYCISQAESSHTKGNSFCPFKSATSFVWSLLRAYDHSWGFKRRSINLMFLSQFPVTGRIFHFRLTGQQNSRRVIHLYITTSTKSNVLERFKSFLFRWFPLSQVSDKIR